MSTKMLMTSAKMAMTIKNVTKMVIVENGDDNIDDNDKDGDASDDDDQVGDDNGSADKDGDDNERDDDDDASWWMEQLCSVSNHESACRQLHPMSPTQYFFVTNSIFFCHQLKKLAIVEEYLSRRDVLPFPLWLPFISFHFLKTSFSSH